MGVFNSDKDKEEELNLAKELLDDENYDYTRHNKLLGFMNDEE